MQIKFKYFNRKVRIGTGGIFSAPSLRAQCWLHLADFRLLNLSYLFPLSDFIRYLLLINFCAVHHFYSPLVVFLFSFYLSSDSALCLGL